MRPLSVEDTLKLETVSQAATSPDGRHILLIKMLAASEKTDFAQDLILGPKTGKLLAIDLQGSAGPRLLIDREGETYGLGPFSPDSKRVLIYWIRGRRLGLGCYNFATGRFTRFERTPQFLSRTDFQPAWISNDEIGYAAEPEGEQPVDLFGRPEAARKLGVLWERSWAGRSPGVVLSESQADGGGREARRGSLVLANVETGATQVIADGLYSDLRLSHDGRFLAALRQYSSAQPPLSLNLDWTSDRRVQLVIFDRQSFSPVFASEDVTVGLGSLEWAPDKDCILFFGWKADATSASGLYYVYDLAQRRLSVRPHRGLDLVSERERGWFPRPERATWLGDGIAVPARPLENSDAPPTFTHRDMSRDAAAPGTGWFLLEPDGAVRPLTAGLRSVSPLVVGARRNALTVIADGQLWQIAPDRRRLPLLDQVYDSLSLAFPPTVRMAVQPEPPVLLATKGHSTSYLVSDFAGQSAFKIVPAEMGEALLAASGMGAALVADESKLSTRIRLRHGATEIPLLALNAFLEHVDLGERRQITYRGAKGEVLSGCLLLPPGYVLGRRYPTIVDIYPGVTGKCAAPSVNFFSDVELLAAHDYVILRPGNPHETDRSPEGPLAGMAAAVDRAIDAAVAAGYSDPDRLGLWGSSQGGFSSLWLATQMKRFKAIASSQGWADLASHYLGADQQNLVFPETSPYALHTARYEPAAGSEFSIGKTLWEAPEIYVRNSPTMQADKVTAPVMLIASDMDIFPLWQYQEMYTALYRLRKPACFMVYMGEGHWPQSPANLRDLWARMFNWFDFYLKGGQDNGCAQAQEIGIAK